MDDLHWCINYLEEYNDVTCEHINLFYDFRSLMNITMPINLSDEFYLRQDNVLKDIMMNKESVDVDAFPNGITVFKGDIISLKIDAIVNAGNSALLGCFVPLHTCVDNIIHSFAGLEVRRDLMKIMDEQGHEEPNGTCKMTHGYNLKCRYICHTVGPIYSGIRRDEVDLTNCYYSCLKCADDYGLTSIAFSTISTGLYGYPKDKACEIALKSVKTYLEEENKNIKKVVFVTFDRDNYHIYKKTLKNQGVEFYERHGKD